MALYPLSGNIYNDKQNDIDFINDIDINNVQDEIALIEEVITGGSTNNISLGNGTLATNPTGNYNIAIGMNALASDTTGQINVAIGANALALITSGQSNVCIGGNSGRSLVTGYGNTFIGEDSGRNATGSQNVFIGQNAGYDETGTKKLIISIYNNNRPLLYGDFLKSDLIVHGSFTATQGQSRFGSYAFLLDPAVSADEGLASDGTYFYWGNDLGDGFDADIYKINASTGALVSTFKGPQHAAGGDYRADHGTILFGGFGWTTLTAYNQVWEINTTTGAKVRSWDFSADFTGTGVYPAYLGSNTLFVMNIHYGVSNYTNDFYTVTINDDGSYTILNSWLDFGDFGKPQDLCVRNGFIYLTAGWKIDNTYKAIYKFELIGSNLNIVDLVLIKRTDSNPSGDCEGIANHNGNLVVCFQDNNFYTVDTEHKLDDVRITNNVGFYNTSPKTKQVVTGSKSSGAALSSLLTALNTIGLITNSTTT